MRKPKKVQKPSMRLKLPPNKNHGDETKYDRKKDKQISRLAQDLNPEDTQS